MGEASLDGRRGCKTRKRNRKKNKLQSELQVRQFSIWKWIEFFLMSPLELWYVIELISYKDSNFPVNVKCTTHLSVIQVCNLGIMAQLLTFSPFIFTVGKS